MNARELLRPKRPLWLAITGALIALGLGAFGIISWRSGWSPGSRWGIAFGTVALLILLIEAAYPMRRRLMARPLRTAQDWLQLHLYGGTLAAVCTLIHMGFRRPGGWLGWCLLGLTLWTTASGLAGVLLQKWVPLRITGGLAVEAIYERIPDLLQSLQAEAAQIMTGAPDVLQRFYASEVQPALAGLSPSWSYLLDVHRGREHWLAPFQKIQAFIPEADRGRLGDLQTIVSEKCELEAHYSLQRALRSWQILHVPPAALLLAAVVVHLVAVWYY